MTATNTRPKPSKTTGKALIVVDVQNDFCEGGSLAVAGGKLVASKISGYLAIHALEYDVIVATKDSHLAHCDNGGHFATDGKPDFANTWPVHCVENTTGSDYAPELATRHIDVHVRKGMGKPAYSGFEGITDDGQELAAILRAEGITDIDVVGIATDYCVKATAIDGANEGFNVTVFGDMTAAVLEDTKLTAIQEMTLAGVHYDATETPAAALAAAGV